MQLDLLGRSCVTRFLVGRIFADQPAKCTRHVFGYDRNIERDGRVYTSAEGLYSVVEPPVVSVQAVWKATDLAARLG